MKKKTRRRKSDALTLDSKPDNLETVPSAQRSFVTLLDKFPALIWRADTDAKCDWFNERWLNFTGRTMEEEVGDGWSTGVHPDDRDQCLKRYLAAFEARQTFEMEYRLQRHDGDYRWIVDVGTPFQDGQGHFAGYIGCCYDVTERKQTQEELTAAKAFIESIVTNVPEVIYSTAGEDLEVIFVSPKCEILTGYTPEDFMKDRNLWTKVIHPDDASVATQLLERVRKGLPCQAEYRFIHKDGATRWVHNSGIPILDSAGKLLRIDGSATDITERKKAEAALRARASQQAAVAAIGRLALLGVDLNTLMDEAVNCVARTLNVELCKVLELLPDRHSLLLRAGVGWKDGYVGSAIVGTERDSQAGYTLLQDVPVIVEDLRTETRFTGPALLHEHGVVSGMSVVISRDKGPFGVIGAHTRRAHLFTQEDADFLQSVANVIGDAIVRKGTEEALRESQRQHSTLLSNLPGMAYRCRHDRHWTIEFVSEGCFDLTGYAARDLLHNRNVTYGGLIHPDDKEWLSKKWQDSLEKKEPCKSEYRIIHATGKVNWVWEQAHGIYSESGELVAVEGFITDITERKEVERGLQEKTVQLEAITDSFSTYLETGNWHEASTMVIRSALELTNSEYGFIGVLVDGPALRILAHAGMSWDETINRPLYEKALRTYEHVGHLEFTNFENLFGKVITTGQPVLSNNPSTDTRSGGLPPGHPPLRCFLGVPILRGSSVVGMIGVANRPGGYAGAEQEQINILTQAGGVLYESYRQREREVSLEAAREQAEEALRGSEERFRQFADTVNEVFWMNELQPRRVIYVNSAFERVWGYSVQSLYDNPRLWEESIHPDDRMRTHEAFQHWILGEAQARLDLDYRIIRPDGHIRWIQDRGVKILDAQKRPSCFAGVATDITERKQVEEALREREQQLLQALDERETISENLHDGVLQSLYAIGLGLENCKLLLTQNLAGALEQMDHAISQLNGVMQEVRHFIVRPDAQLTRRPKLERTLEGLISELIEKRPMKVKLSVEPSAAERLTRNETVHVTYIVKEALSNSVRHGSARTGEISLGWRGQTVHLEVSDNGVGFDLDSVRGRGQGLRNMASRAQKLTGRLQISSHPGQGTRISLTLNGNR